MTRKSHPLPGNLHQQPETWHVAVRQLKMWITPPDEDPYRPFAALVFNLDSEVVQQIELIPHYPTPKQLAQVLFQAMQEPAPETNQKAHRPTQIELEDAEMAETLAPQMEKIGIRSFYQPRSDIVKELMDALDIHMGGAPEPPGLLSAKGATKELVTGFFSAAADFYRAAPWIQLDNEQILAIRVVPERKARFAVVMGAGGVEYGLAVYKRWNDVECLFESVEHPWETLPPKGGQSLFFNDVTMVPIDDLEDIERFGWEVADEQAYPVPITFERDGRFGRPSSVDLAWLQAALRAIPVFIKEHLQPDGEGDYLPVETTLKVSTSTGITQVHIKYPCGTLSLKETPVDRQEWLHIEPGQETNFPAFDRRAMEAPLSQIGGSFGPSELQEAQELMYQAWEESNPGQRIHLARQALKISPDCADAYVLLAEEEAGTLSRALEYYQLGVTAGERALGKGYFKDNVGFFWGLLETRPYMRARVGLATMLWNLDREAEALPHLQDMLRLNPNDNQGIRYILLSLLLSLNRDSDAHDLIKQYEDDISAEWHYTRALLAFREKQTSSEAQSLLQRALKANPHVPIYLTGRKRIPARLPEYVGFGDDNEAVTYAAEYLPYWRKTPGAVDWLKQSTTPTGKKRRTRQRRNRSV